MNAGQMALDLAPTTDSLGGQNPCGTHLHPAAEGTTSPQAILLPAPTRHPPAGLLPPEPLVPWDPNLSFDVATCADALDAIEGIRKAFQSRLQLLVKPADEPDKDGKCRGFGWGLATHAPVRELTKQILEMHCWNTVALGILGEEKPRKHLGCCLEHDAERNLTRALRAHPLGPWVKAQKGIGEKQGGRLIAAMPSDLYVRPEMKTADGGIEPMRKREKGELRAYCGFGEDKSHPGRIQKRQRGQRANWNATAKSRAYLCAEKCMVVGLEKKFGCERVEGDDFATHTAECQCSPFRLIYDRERVRYADAVHDYECPQCGPAGRPALPGSSLSMSHKKGRALRRVAKEIVDALWREAERIHLETPVGGQRGFDTQRGRAADGD